MSGSSLSLGLYSSCTLRQSDDSTCPRVSATCVAAPSCGHCCGAPRAAAPRLAKAGATVTALRRARSGLERCWRCRFGRRRAGTGQPRQSRAKRRQQRRTRAAAAAVFGTKEALRAVARATTARPRTQALKRVVMSAMHSTGFAPSVSSMCRIPSSSKNLRARTSSILIGIFENPRTFFL